MHLLLISKTYFFINSLIFYKYLINNFLLQKYHTDTYVQNAMPIDPELGKKHIFKMNMPLLPLNFP